MLLLKVLLLAVAATALKNPKYEGRKKKKKKGKERKMRSLRPVPLRGLERGREGAYRSSERVLVGF